MNYENNNTVQIDLWNRPEEDPDNAYVYKQGPNVIMNIRKFLPKSAVQLFEQEPEAMEQCQKLIIMRTAFRNKIKDICQHIDYFMEFFDPDKELPMIYFHLKRQIDNGKLSLTPMDFSTILFRKLFCESDIKRHVYEMVEHCYHIDVTVDKKTGRIFNSPDDFTNEDVKRFLAISTMMKIVIPPVEHYMATSSVYKTGIANESLIMEIFVRIFYECGVGILTGDPNDPIHPSEIARRNESGDGPLEPDEADALLTKLHGFVEKRLKKHEKNNGVVWGQHAALRGLTESVQLDRLLKKFIIFDNFFKFNFKDNVVSFLQSIVETQLTFTINIVKYKYDPVPVDDVKPQDGGLSSIDKTEQSAVKIDETIVIKSDLSIQDTIRRLIREVGFISEDEINYYHQYLNPDNFFRNTLMENYFAKEFNGFTELKSMPDRQYVIMTIIAKRRLRRDGFKQLSWLISAVNQGKVSNRILQNTKFTNKLSQSSSYQHLMRDKYPTLIGYKDNAVIEQISKVLNNQYRFVEFDAKELTGEVITFDEDIIADEMLNMIDAI